MSRRWFGFSALIVVAASTYFYGLSRAADPPKAAAAAANNEKSFEGKVLVISVKSHGEYGATLEDVSIKRAGGRDFMVGTSYYEDETVWSNNRPTWIALDDVAQIVEFDTKEDYKAAREK